MGQSAPQPGPVPGPAPVGVAAAPLEDNIAAMLCYVAGFVTGIVFLVMAPYNQNRMIRFHAFQSIFFNVACIVVQIAFYILMAILAIVHLGFLAALLLYPLGLLFFAGWLYLVISAYQGKTVVLPIIGPLAQKQA
jgi:uncharacterized membrane protein